MRTDARARPLKTAPRKSGEFHQAASLLQDTREKPANDLLPGGSTEMQQNQDLLRNWHGQAKLSDVEEHYQELPEELAP